MLNVSFLIPPHEQIFCNRSLNFSSVRAIGFDMDYTLALYKAETFEALTYTESLKKLVFTKDYPLEILDWKFDKNYMIRGLVIDKARGNILKIDRHRYVKVAYHGFRELSRDERKNLYAADHIATYEEPDFALVDTLFSLTEAFLFAQLVEYRATNKNLQEKTFSDLHHDVREAIDLCHIDGSLKDKVMLSPETYLYKESYLVSLLNRLREMNIKTFLLTNSEWAYTNTIMSFLCDTETSAMHPAWLSYFDVVITNASKPKFFMEKQDFKETIFPTQRTRVLEKGNVSVLHQSLGITSGAEILYVGDHIYGDILRSKKEIGWRTMLVLGELEHEISSFQSLKKQMRLCQKLSKKRLKLEDSLAQLQSSFTNNEKNLSQKLEKTQKRLAVIRAQEKNKLRLYHINFHPVWGELMKTGRQNSRFAAQVANYACLYTSKFANLRHYSFTKNYRSVPDILPHEISAQTDSG